MIPLDTDLKEGDEALFVQFYTNERKEYEGQVFVRIMTPGNELNVYDQPAKPEHEARFPKQWLMFRQNDPNVQFVGTPLTKWAEDRPGDLQGDQLSELIAMKFQTVEQVAMASDAQMAKAGMGMVSLRERARAQLKRWAASAGSAENDEMKKRIEELEAQIRTLISIKTPDDPPIPRGPGRPRKEVVDAVNDASTDGEGDE